MIYSEAFDPSRSYLDLLAEPLVLAGLLIIFAIALGKIGKAIFWK